MSIENDPITADLNVDTRSVRPEDSPPAPAPEAPVASVKPALAFAPRIGELGILGVVIAVTPDRSGFRLAMPEWSRLTAKDEGAVSFTASTGTDEHIHSTMLALNAVCELVRTLREVDAALSRVVDVTVAGLYELGVVVVDSDPAEAPTAPTADAE